MFLIFIQNKNEGDKDNGKIVPLSRVITQTQERPELPGPILQSMSYILFFTWLVFRCSSMMIIVNKTRQSEIVLKARGILELIIRGARGILKKYSPRCPSTVAGLTHWQTRPKLYFNTITFILPQLFYTLILLNSCSNWKPENYLPLFYTTVLKSRSREKICSFSRHLVSRRYLKITVA